MNTQRAIRLCSGCGQTGHNVRTCGFARLNSEPPRRRITDDYLREFEHECARRVQTYTPMEFNNFLETEYNYYPNLVITFAMKKCDATRQMSRANIIQLIKDYSVRTYVFGGRYIYEVFNGHSAFREEQRELRERENQELFNELPEIVEEEQNRNLLTQENTANLDSGSDSDSESDVGNEESFNNEVRSMAYALRSDLLAFTLAQMILRPLMPQLDENLRNVLNETVTGVNMEDILNNNHNQSEFSGFVNSLFGNNGLFPPNGIVNNKLTILSSVNNDENEDIHQLCECSICYEDKEVKNYVKFNCNHEFCSTCVGNTIKSRQNRNKICCALCRAEVKSIQCRTNEVKAEIDELIK